MPPSKPTHRDDFSIAIICALPLEYNAVSYVFDEIWNKDGDEFGRAMGDPNSYTTGRIGNWNVVLALLPQMGKANAASAAASMRSSYSHLRLALLVGVCGGVPEHSEEVFLGDVVISQMVVQYDFGRQYPDKFIRKDSIADSLGRPNKDIRNLVALFQTDLGQDHLQQRARHFLQEIQTKVDTNTKRRGRYDYPGTHKDQLFAPQRRHKHYSSADCICRYSMGLSDPICDEALGLSCATLGCDDGAGPYLARVRQQAPDEQIPSPNIHIGVIASGDIVLKSAVDRGRLHNETRAIGFEMEGAGVWDEIPCIIIKAVCDYADSHKHKGWQDYAAAAAASVSKAVLERYSNTDKAGEQHKSEIVKPTQLVLRPGSTVPFPRDTKFIERPIISQWLQRTLAGPGCRAALVGLGGIGKSQLAIQYAYNVRQNDPNMWVLWVHASSTSRFYEAYQDIAHKLELPGRDDPQKNVLQLVYRWLSDETNGPWLMIIDNADDSDILFAAEAAGMSENNRQLASYIPKIGRGSVLVTSRSLKVAERLVGDEKIFEVPQMEPDQATQLLCSKLGESARDSDAASSLLRALDYLPLAIVQAASYIKRRKLRKTTISSYLEEFGESNEKKMGLLEREANYIHRDDSASNAVLTTWQITFDQVQRDQPSAARLLCFMSFFNPQGIPESVLKSYSEQEKEKDLEGDLEVLLGYSLIAVNGCTLEMHALVQFCTQVWLMNFDDKERWRCKFLATMSSQYPFGEVENWLVCRELDPHIQRAIASCPTAEVDIVNWCALLHNAAWYRRTTGKYSEAEAMYSQTIEARIKVLGKEHPNTLASKSNLAAVLWDQGKNSEAEVMNRQILEARIKVLGKEHPNTLESKSNLAAVLRAQGKTSEAEAMNRQTLEARIKTLGMEHPDTLMSMNNLASVLYMQGKGSEAEVMDRQTLEASIKILGKEHPDTLKSMNNLACSCWKRGQKSEALQLMSSCIRSRESELGPDHPHTKKSIATLQWWQSEN